MSGLILKIQEKAIGDNPTRFYVNSTIAFILMLFSIHPAVAIVAVILLNGVGELIPKTRGFADPVKAGYAASFAAIFGYIKILL